MIDEVLAFEYGGWDLPKCSIRHYLVELSRRCWAEYDCFNGKKPFGNIAWKYNLYEALIAGRFIQGTYDEDGYLEDFDKLKADDLINRCFDRLQNG